MRTRSLLKKTMFAGAVAGISMGIPAICVAESAPLSSVASPDVYKVIAENDQFRVVLQTWKPGQKDNFHSHPANAVYWLTDCNRKIVKPDGSTAKEGVVKAGKAVLQKPIVSHSFQNVGDNECQSVMVEMK